MYLNLTFPIISIILFAVALLCGVLVWIILHLRVRSVVTARYRADNLRPADKPEEYSPASVVIYSQGDPDNLLELLRMVLHQDYPAPYEVVVVNEGESAEIRDTVGMLRSSNPNLYLTFTPEGVVNLSRKKLALTLGIKAARYGIVVLTTTAARVESDQWLRRMVRPFSNPEVEVVLGAAYVHADEDTASGFRRRAFDNVATTIRWVGAALAGHPFRGTEFNIAYRKELFLRHKGFARSLNLHYGDDDLFVSQIATGANTAVELSAESVVRVVQGNHPRLFRENIVRRFFTESFIKSRPRIVFPAMAWLQICLLGCSVAGAILSWPNVLGIIIAFVLIAAMSVLDIVYWRGAMKSFEARKLCLTLPFLAATRPLRQLSARLGASVSKQKKYTWD